MRASRSLVTSVLVAAALATTVAGCPSPKDCLSEENAAAEDGEVSDETWLVFKDSEKRATEDDQNSPVFTAPIDGASFKASDGAPTFSWTSELKIAAVFPTAPARTHAGVRPDTDPLRRGFARLSSLLIPPARAHLPPKTGDMYLVEMALDGLECPLGLHTSNLEMKVDEAAWKILLDHKGEDVTTTIVGAYLVQNRVSEGPYKGKTVTFHVED